MKRSSDSPVNQALAGEWIGREQIDDGLYVVRLAGRLCCAGCAVAARA